MHRQRENAVAIAIAAPLSGPSALLGAEMKQAIELALAEWNDAGGVLGAPLASVIADDQGKVETGQAIVHDFCRSPEILGVVGHYNSDVTLAAAPTYHDCGLALISPIVSNPALTERGYANVFRFTNRDDDTGAAIADYLYRILGKRRAVVVATSSLYGQSMADCFAQSFTRLGGKVVAQRRVKEGDRDFVGLIGNLPREFDLLFYGGSFEGAFILRAMRQAALTQLFAAGDGCWDIPGFLRPAAEAASAGEGVLVLSATPQLGRVAGSREFADRYQRRYGPIINYAANAYDAARFLILAIEQAAQQRGGAPDRADVITALRSLTFQGIAYRRPVQWDEKGDNLAAVTALHIVTDGQFAQVAEIARGTVRDQTDHPASSPENRYPPTRDSPATADAK